MRLRAYLCETVFIPGELFLRALAMIILPLIVSSIVSGFANLDATSSKRMGAITLAFYGG